MVARIATFVVLGAAAAGLALLGHWGRANGGAAAPSYLDPEHRARREAVVRRGGLACYAGAAAMAVVAVLAVV